MTKTFIQVQIATEIRYETSAGENLDAKTVDAIIEEKDADFLLRATRICINGVVYERKD